MNREDIISKIKTVISWTLGGYKTVHMGEPKQVVNRQFIYASDVDELSEKLATLFDELSPISAQPPQVTETPTKEQVLKVLGWLREHNRLDEQHKWYEAMEWLDLASQIAKKLTPTGENGEGK